MSYFKGTNAKWEVISNKSWSNGRTDDGHVLCFVDRGKLIAFAGTWIPFMKMTKEEELANIKLISSSLELLKTLELLVSEELLTPSGKIIAERAIVEATKL